MLRCSVLPVGLLFGASACGAQNGIVGCQIQFVVPDGFSSEFSAPCAEGSNAARVSVVTHCIEIASC